MGRLPAVRGRNIRGSNMHEGRLGAMIEMPNPTLIDQLDLPKEQGVVVEDVLPDSAAAKAGLKPHDILLELDGKMVPSKMEEFVKQLDEIKPNTPVDAVVLRKGRKETVKGISLPEAPTLNPNVPLNPGNRRVPPLPGLPGIGGLPGANGLPGLPGGNGLITSVTNTNGVVTARSQEGNLTLTVTGKTEDAKLKVESITVKEGRTTNNYENMDMVPKRFRVKVTTLIEAAEKDQARIQMP